MTEITIGKVVVDQVTRFQGVVTKRCEIMGGAVEFFVEAIAGLMDSAPVPGPGAWFKEDRLELVESEDATPPELGARADAETITNLRNAVEALDALLESTICTCTLMQKCPRHSPERPTIERAPF